MVARRTKERKERVQRTESVFLHSETEFLIRRHAPDLWDPSHSHIRYRAVGLGWYSCRVARHGSVAAADLQRLHNKKGGGGGGGGQGGVRGHQG
jgi:hypothetical protein